MHRAYSFLHVKGVDLVRRLLHGTATAPEPDRVGDMIDPLGVTFKNPAPLLLYHDTKKPIGETRFKRPTREGVDFDAQISSIDRPGVVKDRIDEAWDSLNADPPLIKGVSIGFRELEPPTFIKETGGFRFSKIEVLELSLVVIPAQQQATIHALKSFDTGLAASGTETEIDPQTTPGVSGTVRAVPARQVTRMAKTIAEQIKDFEATRQAKAARRTEIMTKAGEEGMTLDAAQTEEYDGLDVDIKSIDAHLVRLNALEEENKKAARPINGDTPQKAADSRGHQPIQVRDRLEPGIEFARMVMCKIHAFAQLNKGNFITAEEVARKWYPDNPRIQMVLKATVGAGVTEVAGSPDTGFAAALVYQNNLASEFVEFLRPQTIIGRIAGLRRIPFNVRILGQTSGGTGYWVGEGAPKPLTNFSVTPTTLLWSKVANIAVITEELARFSNPSAEAMVRDELSRAIIERMDIDFVDPNKAAGLNGVSPASITNGITPIASSGTEASSVRTDLAALFGAFIADNLNPATATLIMPTATAMVLSLMQNALGQAQFPGITMNGGTLMGIPVVTSQYVTDGSPGGAIIILVNASDIFLADDGQVTVDVSREASLEMSNTPANNSATGTGAQLVSMFQTNSIALRAERFVNWARRREEAVQYLSDVAYSATGSPS